MILSTLERKKERMGEILSCLLFLAAGIDFPWEYTGIRKHKPILKLIKLLTQDPLATLAARSDLLRKCLSHYDGGVPLVFVWNSKIQVIKQKPSFCCCFFIRMAQN